MHKARVERHATGNTKAFLSFGGCGRSSGLKADKEIPTCLHQQQYHNHNHNNSNTISPLPLDDGDHEDDEKPASPPPAPAGRAPATAPVDPARIAFKGSGSASEVFSQLAIKGKLQGKRREVITGWQQTRDWTIPSDQ
ncbi:hypothetical protein FALBO_15291 [Fusarium albosuccineum]|uniref:Uncharacterized protein n=1 Tax=Fusarium albosuccineum TaxID=1237068 RepID=A0A8H4KVJ3_9HYPO|nr:hypothetical protein FALBO_15291 [Fusarium albosuccineum]